MKLNAKELREIGDEEAQIKLKNLKRHPIYFILEDIYDTYNVGGLFRLADALAIEKIYLCGMTEIPPNAKVKKASIGTYKVVPWEYKKTAGEAITELKDRSSKILSRLKNFDSLSFQKKIQIIAIEQSVKAVEYTRADYSLPLALVVGNETSGITKETLDMVDQIVEIPMWGINKSLNVIVSAAIVSYWVMSKKI